MKLPRLENSCGLYLVYSEKSSGIILNFSGTYYLNEGNDYFRFFDDLSSLETFAEQLKNNNSKTLEFLVYDSEGKFVKQFG